MTLDEMMNRFRIAGRELFNHFFHSAAPANPHSTDVDDPWNLEERFSDVEEVLFEKLVCEPAKLTHVGYGKLQADVAVELNSDSCPIMLNREINSGYWDFPLCEVTRDARLLFVRFFDWDNIAYRDNRYVRVQVDAWSSHPEAVGKHALIESHYVHFVRASPSGDESTGST